MNFQISALAAQDFQHYFDMDAETLARHRGRRLIAGPKGGYPCRVSLADAEPGEELLLITFDHQAGDSPYRSSGPIYVRRNAETAQCPPGAVPEMLRRRLLSLRAYDDSHSIVHADVAEGTDLESVVARFFEDPAVAYIHVHNARPGCYDCRIDRA